MELDALYKQRDAVDHVPHLIVDMRCVDYEREDIDFLIILLVCIKYRVKTLEIKVLADTMYKSFLVSDFDAVFNKSSLVETLAATGEKLCAHDMRRLLVDSSEHLWRSLCKFMLMHSAARTVDIYSVSTGENIKSYMTSISKWNISDNFYLQKLVFRAGGKSNGPRLPVDNSKVKFALDSVLNRNRRFFLKKQRTALLLAGLTRRKPALQKICKDVLLLKPKLVIRTPGAQLLGLENKTTLQQAGSDLNTGILK
jgi:hypothetical protein